MTDVFRGSRCGLPAVPSIRTRRLVTDCRVDPAPGPIIDPAPDLFDDGFLSAGRMIFARITGFDMAAPNVPYSWRQVLPGPDGTWVEFGASGTTTQDPAYMLDPAWLAPYGPVPEGTPVELFRGYLNQDWRFDYRPRCVCRPCCTDPEGGDSEVVTWTLQNEYDRIHAVDGQTVHFWINCSPGDQDAVPCFGDTPPSASCTEACVAKVVAIVTDLTNPVTFPLAAVAGAVCSPVVAVDVLNSGMVGCFEDDGPTGTVTRYVQCYKTCADTGTTYTVVYQDVGRTPSGLYYDVFSRSFLPGPPTRLPLADFPVLDQVTFPGDGSSGLVSCSPLLLSASHTVNTLFCGLPALSSTNQITVTDSGGS